MSLLVREMFRISRLASVGTRLGEVGGDENGPVLLRNEKDEDDGQSSFGPKGRKVGLTIV